MEQTFFTESISSGTVKRRRYGYRKFAISHKDAAMFSQIVP